MARRKRRFKFKYVAIAAVMVAGFAALFVYRTQVAGWIEEMRAPKAAPAPKAVYKEEDRRKLEQLINAGTKDD